MSGRIESYHGFHIGDQVSIKHPYASYDDHGIIPTEAQGTIQSFPPKVSICKIKPTQDSLHYFAYVKFSHYVEYHGRSYQLRGGIDICNLKLIHRSAK